MERCNFPTQAWKCGGRTRDSVPGPLEPPTARTKLAGLLCPFRAGSWWCLWPAPSCPLPWTSPQHQLHTSTFRWRCHLSTATHNPTRPYPREDCKVRHQPGWRPGSRTRDRGKQPSRRLIRPAGALATVAALARRTTATPCSIGNLRGTSHRVVSPPSSLYRPASRTSAWVGTPRCVAVGRTHPPAASRMWQRRAPSLRAPPLPSPRGPAWRHGKTPSCHCRC